MPEPLPLRYLAAPPGWTYTDPNPFAPGGAYGWDWSAFVLTDDPGETFYTGRAGAGPFSARFGRGTPNLEQRLADFLRYESAHARAVILLFPADFDPLGYAARALACHRGDVVRDDDPAVLVHTTTRAAWGRIRAEGALKAASELGGEVHGDVCLEESLGELADYLRHEPPEYREYIMLGEVGALGPEMVAASFQLGRFVMDPETRYAPGARLYLDAHRLIRDGLATRDGLHALKVKARLPLEPYLLGAVSADDLAPSGAAAWTVRAFTEQADAAFARGREEKP